MSILSARVDLSQVDRGMAALSAAGKDPSPVFRALRKPMRADQVDHSKKQQGPDGSWPAKSPLTIARERRRRRKSGRRGRVRKLLGRLPGAFKVVADRRRVAAIWRPSWAGAHLEGGRVGRGSTLPVRAFGWVSPALYEKARNLFEVHLTGAFG